MRNYLIGNGEGEMRVLIEWDAETGEMEIRLPNEPAILLEGLEITHGIAGVDRIYWQGSVLVITEQIHEYFKREYPTTDLKSEYMNADSWCVRKKRKVKNHQMFMNNWLKRSRGGDFKSGGGVY